LFPKTYEILVNYKKTRIHNVLAHFRADLTPGRFRIAINHERWDDWNVPICKMLNKGRNYMFIRIYDKEFHINDSLLPFNIQLKLQGRHNLHKLKVYVDTQLTFNDLKFIIYNATNLPMINQEIIVNNKLLLDTNATLTEYKIDKNGEIFVLDH
jgi:hypothetical protein